MLLLKENRVLEGLKKKFTGRLVPAGTGLTKIEDKQAREQDKARIEELKKQELNPLQQRQNKLLNLNLKAFKILTFINSMLVYGTF